jgi:hypothetical protein
MNANYSSANYLSGAARIRIAFGLLAIGCLAVSFETAAQEPVAAVFKTREVDFYYRSNTTPYACHELRNVVANILRATGARDDIDVNVSDCEFVVPHGMDMDTGRMDSGRMSQDRWDPMGSSSDRFRNRNTEREQSAHVRIRLMTPVPLTPEVLAEINKDKSRRELVSRVTGNPAAKNNDPIVFPASRQPVTLSRSTVRLEPEDCELLEQMSRSVFRELDIRVVRRDFTCDSRQTSRITPQLTVEALLPVASTARIPGQGQYGPAPATGETPPSQAAPPETATETP